jgi:WD40 repeat protein
VTELSRLGKGALLGAADYSPDGRFLAVPTAFGVYLRIAFTPDGMRLAAGSRDGTISIWGIPAPGSIFHSLFQKFR